MSQKEPTARDVALAAGELARGARLMVAVQSMVLESLVIALIRENALPASRVSEILDQVANSISLAPEIVDDDMRDEMQHILNKTAANISGVFGSARHGLAMGRG